MGRKGQVYGSGVWVMGVRHHNGQIAWVRCMGQAAGVLGVRCMGQAAWVMGGQMYWSACMGHGGQVYGSGCRQSEFMRPLVLVRPLIFLACHLRIT